MARARTAAQRKAEAKAWAAISCHRQGFRSTGQYPWNLAGGVPVELEFVFQGIYAVEYTVVVLFGEALMMSSTSVHVVLLRVTPVLAK